MTKQYLVDVEDLLKILKMDNLPTLQYSLEKVVKEVKDTIKFPEGSTVEILSLRSVSARLGCTVQCK